MQQPVEKTTTPVSENSKLYIVAYCDGLELLPDALEGLPGFDPEDNVAIMERSDLLVEREVEAAYDRMAPLLAHRSLAAIDVFVDLADDGTDRPGLAALQYGSCRPDEGVYAFSASRQLAYHYLKAHEEPGYKPSACVRIVWDHEFMHVADIDNVLEVDRMVQEDSREAMYKVHLLHFRLEGVADLLAWMESDTAVTELPEAYALFVEERKRIRPFMDNPEEGRYTYTVGEVRNHKVFYQIGPLMVIDLLSRTGNNEAAKDASNVLEMRRRNEVIPQEMRMDVLRHALGLDNQSFLEGYAEWANVK
jgi:hypothetical protein